VNFGIIGLVVVAGVLIANVGTGLVTDLGVSTDLVGVATLAAVVTLAVPAGIALWGVLCELGTLFAQRVFARFRMTSGLQFAEVASIGLVSLLLMASGVWLVTRLLDMMPVGDVTSPVPALVMVLSAAVTASAAMKIHSQMDKTFRRTLLGDGPAETVDEADSGEA
jgi:hypothetical protein